MSDFQPDKRLGQNFLQNAQIAANTVKLLDIQPEDRVLEIGPGPGTLTKFILDYKFKELTLVEFDKRFLPTLNSLLHAHYDLCKIVNENVLDYLNNTKIETDKLLGAIPYNITSPIFRKVAALENLPKKIVFIVQLEVAKKIAEDKDGSSYWNMLLFMYDRKIIQKVESKEFSPEPQVDSAVFELTINPEKLEFYKTNIQNPFKWSKFLDALFVSPRKKLNKIAFKNNIESLGIALDLRPHQLTEEQILNIFVSINKSGILLSDSK